MDTLLYGALSHRGTAFRAEGCSFSRSLLLDACQALLSHILREAALLLEVAKPLVDLRCEQLLDTFAEHYYHARRANGVVFAEL